MVINTLTNVLKTYFTETKFPEWSDQERTRFRRQATPNFQTPQIFIAWLRNLHTNESTYWQISVLQQQREKLYHVISDMLSPELSILLF